MQLQICFIKISVTSADFIKEDASMRENRTTPANKNSRLEFEYFLTFYFAFSYFCILSPWQEF